jgi:hypothetical protein
VSICAPGIVVATYRGTVTRLVLINGAPARGNGRRDRASGRYDGHITAMYPQLLGGVAARPASRIVTTVGGDADATYAALREQVPPPTR